MRHCGPADLRGKRIGVPEYQQTWAIWSRGILQHEFGVHAREIEWFMERNPDKSHGGATGFTAPAGVRVNQISPTTKIGEMLIRGELDGALHYLVDRNLVDRSTVDVSGVTRYLFSDPAAEGRRFYAKTSLFPINHTVVVQRALLERHPWIALNLYSAFVAAKEEIARYGQSYLQWYFETGLLDGGAKRALAEHDPLAYGFKAARRCSRRSRNTCTSKGYARAGWSSRKSSPPAPSTCEREISGRKRCADF